MNKSLLILADKLCIMCIGLLLMISPASQAEDVLIIESYNSSFKWDQEYVDAVRAELEPGYSVARVAMETNGLDKKYFSAAAYRTFQAYLTIKPKVVVLGDDTALNYMLPLLYQEPINIVFLGINGNPRQLIKRYQGSARVTGVLERPYFIETIGEIAKMLPVDRRKLLILFDSGSISPIARTYMQQKYQLIAQNMNLDIQFEEIATEREWQQAVNGSRQQGYGAILLGVYHNLLNSDGKRVDDQQLLSWTSQNSPLPVFALWNFSVGIGKAIGGVVVTGEEQGRLAGQIALDILDNGTDANTIPIRSQHEGFAVYSKREMDRWGLTAPKSWWDIDDR